MKILVIGATGALGRPLVKALRARGVAVRAACRHPEQAADLAALGAEVIGADLIDRDSLRRACAGIDRVLMAAHSILGRGRWRSQAVDEAGVQALIEEARQAGVGRFVYCSAFGARADHPIDFWRSKFKVEQVLTEGDGSDSRGSIGGSMHTVILRPTAFMEHHAHNFNGKALLDKGKVQLIGPGSKPRNFIAATDVAWFAEQALLQDPLPFTLLELGGHGHYSNTQVAELYAQTANVPLRIGRLPLAVARVISRLAAPLHPGLARIMKIFSLPDSAFDEHFHGATELEARFGIKLMRLEDFVRAQVQAARG